MEPLSPDLRAMEAVVVGAAEPASVVLEARLRAAQLVADVPTVVVSSLVAHLAVEIGGILSQGVFRYTRVWAYELDGRWRVVAGHLGAVQS